jgi:hypothetical protein
MKEVHFIAQGKGGVGKSFVASLLAQYLKERVDSDQVHCFDTDPVNPTFSRYPALNAQVVNILTATNNIDSRQFDGLIEQLIEKEGVAVVDNGAATFIPLMSYMAENGVVDLLNDVGTRIIIHVPVVGGQALEDCLTGLAQTIAALNAEVVVWLNHQLGAVQDGGDTFEDFKVFKSYSKSIVNIIELPLRNPDTFAKDIQMMTSRNLTFNEVMESSEFSIMPKQRLKTVKRDVFEQLDQKPLFSVEVGHE